MFEMNGKIYSTDEETLKLLREIVPSAKKSGDMSAVTAVMSIGLMTGRIAEQSENFPVHSVQAMHQHEKDAVLPDGTRAFIVK